MIPTKRSDNSLTWAPRCLAACHPRPARLGIASIKKYSQLDDNVLNGLWVRNIDMLAYFGKHLRRVVNKFNGSRVSLADMPFNLHEDLPGKAVAVHNGGGSGVATAAILAGISE